MSIYYNKTRVFSIMKNEIPFDIFSSLSSQQINSLKEIENTFSNLQCAWLSGYFWSIANKKSLPGRLAIKEQQDQCITIISASQTGNAKLLSKRLDTYLKNNNKTTNLISASDYKFKKIVNERILILIISTQGEGEPPEEAWSLYKYIMSKKAPKLNNLYYSIFALGDTSYDFFCQSGKDFDKRLEELGGKFFLKRCDADIEYEDDYKKWSKELLFSLNKITNNVNPVSLVSDIKSSHIISTLTYTKNNPIKAIILVNQKITGRNSIKDVRHIEIDISNLNIHYTPGDALGIWYKNDIGLVQRILDLLSINISDTVLIKDNMINIFDALKDNFELTNNTKNIVKNYAFFTENKFLKSIVSDNEKLRNYAFQTPFVKMIHDYPEKLSAKQLISLLRPLTPRLYSISSSQNEVNDEVHITVGVVRKLICGQIYLGGASGYLSKSLKPDDQVNIFVEVNNNFRLPSDGNVPIIMIGSGTGIAPFRSFMQQRDSDGSKGKNWIFFGNPNFTEDFLYQLEWQKYLKQGLLTKMNLAWSRDQENKVYVQDKIRENGKEIWSWIKDGAQIYICGNASRMAKDVENEILCIIGKNSGMDFEGCNEFLNNLRANRRYQRDVY